jgi:hypothetical protein
MGGRDPGSNRSAQPFAAAGESANPVDDRRFGPICPTPMLQSGNSRKIRV